MHGADSVDADHDRALHAIDLARCFLRLLLFKGEGEKQNWKTTPCKV